MKNKMHQLQRSMTGLVLIFTCTGWGFFAHQKINRLAVFILPPGMIVFYKKNIQYVTEAAVNPDRRRYTLAEEGARHYIDIDRYEQGNDSIPPRWDKAVQKFGEDSLNAHGIVPWHITRMFFELKNAFLIGDPKRILRISAELGHYVSDAHVPLHTTSNYDGQKTEQHGIHALWESRLPELFSSDYDFFVGKAAYVPNVQQAVWIAVNESHAAVDSVLDIERSIFKTDGERKFNFETKARKTIKVVAVEYARQYHKKLAGMVERRMRASVKMTGDLWFTAWVDAGQPDLKRFIGYAPSEEELRERREEVKAWNEANVKALQHE